jgi:malonate transporter
MSSVFGSLFPVFLVIAAGWTARVTGFVEERHWAGLERATYMIFFPALIVDTLARADLGSVPVLGTGGALVVAILTISGLVLLLRKPLERGVGMEGPAFTSLFQGATRWNTFVALAVAGSLYGPRGVTVMAVAIAAMVPLLNVLAVSVLGRYASGKPQDARAFARTLVTNPFIWSCALGLALNLTLPPLPKPIWGLVEILGKASLGAGLLVVGAGLDLKRLVRPNIAHLLSCVAKLLLLPVVAASAARLFGIGGVDLGVTVLAASVPTASGAYVLAKQMGGDAPLMAEIITLQTLVGLATIPLMMALLAGA